jgi:outer membrane protein assembly factor BamB
MQGTKLFLQISIAVFVALNTHAQILDNKYVADTTFTLPHYNLISPTFLGNYERNYYGNEAPDTLNIIWKHYLGKGKTTISRKRGDVEWAGAGWTGQPLLTEEDSTLYIIQGAYDHHLKKINASNGNIVWQYKFDDVVKGTGTIWENPDTSVKEDRLLILQGSRLGYGKYLDTKYVPSYRAISYFTGKEKWRHNSKFTRSYSRDVDGSALIYNDTAYIGLENSLFTKFNPDPKKARIKDGMLQPEVFNQIKLYTQADAKSHGGNLVTESSPCILDSVIYVASGTGHIFGYSLKTDTLVWDFFIGSDIDGSAVATHDSCIIVTIEKQYIDGQGGAMKLNPKKAPSEAVVWFYPTENKEYASWEGGIIGSVGITDAYKTDSIPYLAAFSAIDGNLYVVEHTKIDSSKKVFGPNLKYKYYKPQLVFKYKTGTSISTPIFVNNKLIAAGYGGVNLFVFNSNLEFIRKAKHGGTYEATPVVHNRRIYIASRNGYFYCLGD